MAKHDTKKLIAEFDGFAKDGGYEKTFVCSYPHAYELFTQQIMKMSMSNDARILDLGCGDPWTASLLDSVLSKQGVPGARYLGIDPSAKAIESLNALAPEMLEIQGIVGTADDLISGKLDESIEKYLGRATLVICNAAIHQILKFETSIEHLLSSFADHCDDKRASHVMIGDYHYPPSLSDEKVEESREWIRQTTGQTPSPRESFVTANDVCQWMQNSGLKVLTRNEVQANDRTLLHYYNIVFGF